MIIKSNVFDRLPEQNSKSSTDSYYVTEQIIKIKRTPSLVKAQEKYYIQNKDKIVKKQMEYNETYFKQIMTCECGITHSRAAKYAHVRSPRHFRRLENIKNGKLAGARIGDTRVNCACGGHYLQKLKKQHFNTQKHKKFIENIENDKTIKVI